MFYAVNLSQIIQVDYTIYVACGFSLDKIEVWLWALRGKFLDFLNKFVDF